MNKVFANLATHRNTTAAGVAMILIGVGSIVLAFANGEKPDWEVSMTGIVAGVGLIMSSDAGKKDS